MQKMTKDKNKNIENDFNLSSIVEAVQNQQDITIKQLNNEIKQLRHYMKDIVKDVLKLQKNIQLKANTTTLTENTILMNTQIQPDPAILKLITKSNNYNIQNQITYNQDNLQQNTNNQLNSTKSNESSKLKIASIELGRKLNQITDGLPVLLGLIKSLQKQKNTQINQLKNIINQKFTHLQQQFNLFRDADITSKLKINQKIQQNHMQLNQKVRFIDNNIISQLTQIKRKLSQKIQSIQFQDRLAKAIQTIQSNLRIFKDQSESLVNPQKIKQLQNLILSKSASLTKQMTDCQLKAFQLQQKINLQVISVQYYKKQRVGLEKRLFTTNNNFQDFFKKVLALMRSSQDHQIRVISLQKQSKSQFSQLNKMQKVLSNLNITQDFQKMLANINPQQILKLQTKIAQVEQDYVNIYREINNSNRQIDKLSSKFQISGIIIPNQSRDKQFYLNDLKEIINGYFVQNRYACKISKLQNDFNQNKYLVDSVRALEKKLARVQKESQFNKFIEEFQRLEEYTKAQLAIFEQKINQTMNENQITKNFIRGMRTASNTKIDEQINRRKSLISQNGSRQQNTLSREFKSNSLRNVMNIESMKKEMNQTFTKNTISSRRKNVLKNTLLYG